MATATYISGTSFSISGNMIAEFCVGRAVRCDCGTAGTFTGYITSSSYSSSTGLTTVVVSLDTGSLTNQLSSVSHGNDVPASMCRATQLSVGAVLLATSVISVAGTDAAKPITPATQRQAVLSWVRDSLGKFPGITPPSLNLFCGEATDDTVPIGAFTRSTVGTRRGPTGLIESVAAGSPRREWDASGNLLGWLMEESRTNLLPYSAEFENAGWLKSSCTITPDAAIAPDGNVTADKLVESASAGPHMLYIAVAVTSGRSYTFSLHVKAGEWSRFRIDGSDTGFGAGNYADFNLASTTATAYGNAVATIIPLGNGWYRCSCTFQAIASITTNFSIITVDDTGSVSYTGTGSSGLYIWGAQCEVGAFSTSYIPTTSAAVARSADIWSIAVSGLAYRQSEGSVIVVFDSIAGPVASTNNTVLGLHDGTLSNRIFLRSNNSLSGIHCLMVYANETQVDIHLTPATKNAMKKCAIYYINNKTLFVENGGIIANDTLCTIPTITTINVGSGLSGADALNGHIKHIAYFPTALSDTQLQAITL